MVYVLILLGSLGGIGKVRIDGTVRPFEKVYRMSVNNFILDILLSGCLWRGEVD